MIIKIGFNDLGMLMFSCDHVNGYSYDGKGKNICSRCRKKLEKIISREMDKWIK